MTLAEIMDATMFIPPIIKDIACVAIIFSLIEIAPIKINPWKWLKAFVALPSRLDKLEKEVNADRAYRWRSMILTRADFVRRGEKFSEERWNDTVETIDHYEKFCRDNPDVKNGKASTAIEYLRDQYKMAYKEKDYLI